MDRRTFLSIALAAPALSVARPAAQPGGRGLAWMQWGGPHRNFQTDATGIKDVWPAGGPRVVWKRPLGEGYSAPVVEGAPRRVELTWSVSRLTADPAVP